MKHAELLIILLLLVILVAIGRDLGKALDTEHEMQMKLNQHYHGLN